jgi:hypothetical protein
MNFSNTSFFASFHKNQRGNANLKAFIVIGALLIIGYCGYQYVPVAYNASLFKVFLQDKVNQASALGRSGAWLEEQIRANGNEYNLPPDAVITVVPANGKLTARVQYKRDIPMLFYTYEYDFDHTVTSSGFFNIQ